MSLCPSNLQTVYKSPPAAMALVANVWRATWKLRVLFMPTDSAIFFSSTFVWQSEVNPAKTFWLAALLPLSGNHDNAMLLNGMRTECFVFCMESITISHSNELCWMLPHIREEPTRFRNRTFGYLMIPGNLFEEIPFSLKVRHSDNYKTFRTMLLICCSKVHKTL